MGYEGTTTFKARGRYLDWDDRIVLNKDVQNRKSRLARSWPTSLNVSQK